VPAVFHNLGARARRPGGVRSVTNSNAAREPASEAGFARAVSLIGVAVRIVILITPAVVIPARIDCKSAAEVPCAVETQAACAALEAAADAYPTRRAKVHASRSTAGKPATEVPPFAHTAGAMTATKAAAMTATAPAMTTAATATATSERVCLNRRHPQGNNRKDDTDFTQHDALHYGHDHVRFPFHPTSRRDRTPCLGLVFT
jgi:hypothetical protein